MQGPDGISADMCVVCRLQAFLDHHFDDRGF